MYSATSSAVSEFDYHASIARELQPPRCNCPARTLKAFTISLRSVVVDYDFSALHP